MTYYSGATAIGQPVSALPSWAHLQQKYQKELACMLLPPEPWRLHESGAADLVIRLTVL